MKMMMRPMGQQGFSLIELLVAMTVLSIGLFAVASMQMVALSNGAVSNRMMAATELAKEAMEDVLAWDPAKPELNASLSDQSYRQNVQVRGGGTFNITYTTTVSTPSIGTTRIKITVSEVTVISGKAIAPVVVTGYRKVV